MAYEESGSVRALSVLTNSRHFGGRIERLRTIRNQVSKPVLRKDFIIGEYQIREARAFGADAILLMASVLDAARLKGFYELALELGMEALFEVHDEAEVGALTMELLVLAGLAGAVMVLEVLDLMELAAQLILAQAEAEVQQVEELEVMEVQVLLFYQYQPHLIQELQQAHQP